MYPTKILHSILLLTLTAVTALSQQVAFKSEASKTALVAGEAFSVGFFIQSSTDSYSIDEPMKYPDHKGLRIVGENRSQNVQFVNGRGMIEDGVILVFVGEKPGKYKIGASKIVIDGKTYTTKPIDIEIAKTAVAAAVKSTQQAQPVFLQSDVSKQNPYVNEQVGLTVKLYARDLGMLNRKRNFRQGKLEGLSPKMVKNSPETIKQEMISGKQYFSEEIARYYVFPQKPGRIEIDPFSLDVLVSGTYGTEVYEIKSNPVVINAKALPEGKPASFKGAVGQFELNTSVDKTELKANESINMEVEITGSGNLNGIIFPTINTSENLEKYAPKKRDAYKTYPRGMQGKVVQENVLVPNFGGEYSISPVEFSYFDPEKEKYITLKSDSIHIHVDGEAAPLDKDNTMMASINDHQKQNTPSDRFQNTVNEITNSVPQGKAGWIWLTGGVLALAAMGLVIMKKKKKKMNDESTIHPRSFASSFAPVAKIDEPINPPPISSNFVKEMNQELEQLKLLVHAVEQRDFFQLQEQILGEAVMKKTGIDLANFTVYTAVHRLKVIGCNPSLIDEWQDLINKAKHAKYAFDPTQQDLQATYLRTQKMVSEIIHG